MNILSPQSLGDARPNGLLGPFSRPVVVIFPFFSALPGLSPEKPPFALRCLFSQAEAFVHPASFPFFFQGLPCPRRCP